MLVGIVLGGVMFAVSGLIYARATGRSPEEIRQELEEERFLNEGAPP